MHLDQLRGSQRGFRRLRNYRRHLFADKTHAVLRENIPVVHIQPESEREILARNHPNHARGLFCRGNIHFLELGMRLRAFNHHRMQQPRTKIQVVRILRRAHDLGQAVPANRRSAYNSGFAHERTLRDVDWRAVFFATASTVFTMGS